MILIIAAVFVLPFVIGNFLAKAFKMPNHAMQMGIILATIFACTAILLTGQLRKGIDIIGGTDLIYELDREAMKGDGLAGSRITAKDLVKALGERLNPAGTKELMIRPIGDDQIQIIVPAVDQMEVDEIKRMIENSGILEFKIVANGKDHLDIIGFAQKQMQSTDDVGRMSRDVLNDEGKVVAVWRKVGREDIVKNGVRKLRIEYSSGVYTLRDASTGKALPFYAPTNESNAFEKWLDRNGIPEVEVLLALERQGNPFDVVTGSDISSARVSTGPSGGYEVNFKMRNEGAQKLSRLTRRNQPDTDTDFKRQMAILLDNQVLSAPSLNQAISSEGMIQGNFTRAEAEFLQKILQSGSLPAALNKTPINETVVGAELGANAISRGFLACLFGLIATSIFMLVYYHFSGIIACVALLLNLLIVLAAMVLIRQPITLPGLAGLILSVGMSVDANVLVFERIREEIAKKSTGRLAIRNGFDRALTTIVDSNLTTLISGIILYWVGTDQVRGFAVTLIIGLISSMFTAVFCSRVIFEVCEKLRLVRFSMFDIVAFLRRTMLGNKDIDFMSFRKVCYAASGLLMLIGLVAPFIRGSQILDIDFAGGTQHVFVVDRELETDKVREACASLFASDDKQNPIQTNVTSVELDGQAKRVFKLITSLKDVNEVSKRLVEGFEEAAGAKLITYSVETNLSPAASSQSFNQESIQNKSALSLTPAAFQEPATTETAPATTETAPATTESAPATTDAAAPATADAAAPATATEQTAALNTPTVRTSIDIKLKSDIQDAPAKINGLGLIEKLVKAGSDIGLKLNDSQIQVLPKGAEGWTRESNVGYSEWTANVPLDESKSRDLVGALEQQLASEPAWQSVSKVESRVAGDMQAKAVLALVASLVCIMIYIWFRFQRLSYGLAALLALIHDVLITLAFVAVSHWLFRPLGFLLIEDFKISLTMVAAFLTIIGYSLNDTIVVFDRIREVKGKAPRLTSAMINQSVNQTLGRTLLTSATTIFAVLLMYIFGGEALHAFCYALLIGIVVGTYSSIFVAAPLLLWFAQREENKRLARAA
jgi:SecD/SecF fusion protein